MVIKAKTFFNCFFYASANEKGNAVENDILEYVTHAQRINYGDPSFKAIKDQLRTRSTSAVLYRVLQRGELNLCIYKKELPSSFKVFCAKDKLNSNKKSIFVDCTGLIEYQNGSFYCKDIDRLATYLSGALVHMIYYNETAKLVGNANLQKSSTSAFVKMFARVMDYLKVNNYIQNRDRILYIVGVYFAYNVIGMDIESAKRVSAVVNRVNEMDRKSHDMRFIEDDLSNINIFMESLTRTFKLVGMNTAVFANKWLYLYGKGTLYSLELFPAFLCTMMYAYAGTYVNYWKAIETVCGKDMTDIANIVFKVGSDIYSRGYSYESAEMRREAEKIAAEASYCMNPPEGFSFKSVDDKDFNMESYTIEMELGGLINLNEETAQMKQDDSQVPGDPGDTTDGEGQKDPSIPSGGAPGAGDEGSVKAAQQEMRDKMAPKQASSGASKPTAATAATKGANGMPSDVANKVSANTNKPAATPATKGANGMPSDVANKVSASKPTPSTPATKGANGMPSNVANKISKEAATEDKVESAEDTIKKVKAMKEALEEKRLQSIKEDKAAALSPTEVSKAGLEIGEDDKKDSEIVDLVDQLDEDNPMEESTDLGDDQAAAEAPIENDNPMKDKETEAETLSDEIEADNPMKEEAVQDGNEIAKEEIDNHDSTGEPRDSEEVKSLVDAIENDNPM